MKISWTTEAQETYFNILDYLQANWTNKEIESFLKKTQKVIDQITINPKMFRLSKQKNIHIGFITKQTCVIYKSKPNEIILLTFWDNRQNPQKLKY